MGGLILFISLIIILSIAALFFYVFKKKKAKEAEEELRIKEAELHAHAEMILKRKEEELQQIKKGNTDIINSVIQRILNNIRITAWVKESSFELHNLKTLSISIKFFPKEEIIETQTNIQLKSGGIYTEDKDFEDIMKEYSEKIFKGTIRIINDIFTEIPILENILINSYIPTENNKYICVIEVPTTREIFSKFKGNLEDKSPIDVLKIFNAKFSYDNIRKNLESITAGTIKDYFSDFEKKIATDDLELSPQLQKFINSITKLIHKMNLKIISEKIQNNSDFIILAQNDNPVITDKYLILSKLTLEPIALNIVENFVEKVKLSKSSKGIIITTSTFTLDTVEFALNNNIELIDKKKLIELLKKYEIEI